MSEYLREGPHVVAALGRLNLAVECSAGDWCHQRRLWRPGLRSLRSYLIAMAVSLVLLLSIGAALLVVSAVAVHLLRIGYKIRG